MDYVDRNKRDGKFWEKERNRVSRAWDSDLRIQRSDAVSEVYYKVHMTRVLHTARIGTVDSVMFVDRTRRDGKF